MLRAWHPFRLAVIRFLSGSLLAWAPSGFAAVTGGPLTLDLGGGVGMEFVPVPVNETGAAKEIEIGDFASPDNPKEPRQKAFIQGAFRIEGKGWCYYLGKTEVTEAQWRTVMGDGGSSRLPVTDKTYGEIQAFIDKLNQKLLAAGGGGLPRKDDCTPEHKVGTPGVVVLPTEAAWEFAARGGEGPHYKDNQPSREDLARQEVLFEPGSSGNPKPVGSRQPGNLGLCDMLGNVREFVSDVGSSGTGNILKGGSFHSQPTEIHFSLRDEQAQYDANGQPTHRPDAGFRLCITAPERTRMGQQAVPLEREPALEEAPADPPGFRDAYDTAYEALDAALTAHQTKADRQKKMSALVPNNKDGYFDPEIRKLESQIREQKELVSQGVAAFLKARKGNPEAAKKAFQDRSSQLEKRRVNAPPEAAKSAAEALADVKKMTGMEE